MEEWIAILVAGAGIIIVAGGGIIKGSTLFGGLRRDVANLSARQEHNCTKNDLDHKEIKGDIKVILKEQAEQGKAIAYINGQKNTGG